MAQNARTFVAVNPIGVMGRAGAVDRATRANAVHETGSARSIDTPEADHRGRQRRLESQSLSLEQPNAAPVFGRSLGGLVDPLPIALAVYGGARCRQQSRSLSLPVERADQRAEAVHIGEAIPGVLGATGRRQIEDEIEIIRETCETPGLGEVRLDGLDSRR
jgi:hypothetical protein